MHQPSTHWSRHLTSRAQVGPVEVGRESVELLLLHLRSLSRKPLRPEALAADFGPQGDVAPYLVNVF